MVRAWDVFDNVATKTIDFVVAKNKNLELMHVLNYPNPFSNKTVFYFECNQFNMLLNVKIQIYTITGKQIKTIQNMITMDGNRNDGIFWDGTDDFGDKLAKGVYIYRLVIWDASGRKDEVIEKLFIL